MDFNLITNIQTCYSDIPEILYYSHIPSAIAVLFIGIFVYAKNKRLLEARLLLLIAVLFALWVMADVIIWISPDSRIVMLLWSIINLFEMLISLVTLYFAYVFLEKKDVSLRLKIIALALLVPFIFLMPTTYNLQGFDVAVCESKQGPLIYYFYVLESLFSLWLLAYLGWKTYQAPQTKKKQTLLFSGGVILFLFSFSGTNIIASYTEKWWILQYGLFGAPLFCALLAYLIVKYRVFNVKLLAVQALVVTLVLLLGSQLFFISNPLQFTLLGITLIFLLITGRILVISVTREVERKEELQRISDNLAIANERLKELDLTKSEFISIASHQLRTPLTAIKGYISLLLEGSYGKVSVPIQDILNKIYMVNNRLVHLVEDLLNVSRIEAGRIQYNFAPTQLEPLIVELVDMFRPAAKEKKLSLKMQLSKNPLPQLTIDPNKIKEVLSNLIDNALKYTKEGDVTVSLERASDIARIIVSDTGIGIRPEDKKNLFEKFLRSKETTKMVVSGAGLGLYVGKSFVVAHGGRIWAESDGPDKGSRFVVELPFVNSKIQAGTSDQPTSLKNT